MYGKSLSGVLASIPLFQGADADTLDSMAWQVQGKSFKKGECVIEKGCIAHGFYYIERGQVKLSFISEQGNEKVVELLGEGATFGEAAMFVGQPIPVFVQACMPTRLLFIRKEAVWNLIERCPDVAMHVIASLSRRLHSMFGEFESLCLLSSRERVTGFLLRELRVGAEPGVKEIRLPSTKAATASLLNLTPETFSRVIHGLEREGIVNVDGRRVEVLDEDRLRAQTHC